MGCHATEWDAVGWDRGDGKSCDAMGCNVWDELQCNDVRCGGMGWMGWGLMRCPVRHRSTLCPITSLRAGLGAPSLLPFPPSSFGALRRAGSRHCPQRAPLPRSTAPRRAPSAPNAWRPRLRSRCAVPGRGDAGGLEGFAPVPPLAVTDSAAPHIASPWARGAARSCGQIGADVQGAGWEGAVFPPPSFLFLAPTDAFAVSALGSALNSTPPSLSTPRPSPFIHFRFAKLSPALPADPPTHSPPPTAPRSIYQLFSAQDGETEAPPAPHPTPTPFPRADPLPQRCALSSPGLFL